MDRYLFQQFLSMLDVYKCMEGFDSIALFALLFFIEERWAFFNLEIIANANKSFQIHPNIIIIIIVREICCIWLCRKLFIVEVASAQTN